MGESSLLLLDVERLADDAEYRLELRHLCQTDPFFLAPLLGYNDFSRRIHQPVADLYVKKKPGLAIADQDPVKNRMHLDPRHTFKTTFGIVDTVQWIITDPNITIVNETATKSLGTLLTRRIARSFFQAKGKLPSIFQQLFPEYVIGKLRNDYIAPCRTRDEVEPTLYSTSVGSSQSGYHPWIINPDDMVDTENSGIDASDDSRERVWNTYQTNLNTLRHGGYVNIRGTRYHPFDVYGKLLRVLDEKDWKLLIRSSMTVKTGKRLVEGEFPAEEEVDLLFGEMPELNYRGLRNKFRTDYRSFMCQQQNDPQGGGVAIFPAERYDQAQIAHDRVPSLGEVRICWRFPCESKDFMHYAEAVAVKYVGSRVYLVDAWRGVYTPTELIERVVEGAKRHQCGEITIENTPGSESLIPHIYNEAARRNWSLKIDRPDFENDDAVRIGRMKQLEPMMRTGRIWFTKDSGQSDELKNQFTNFGLIGNNGLVDAMSRLALRLPISVYDSAITQERKAAMAAVKEMGVYGMIYGDGGAVQVEEALAADQQQEQYSGNSYGMRPLLGGLDG